MTDKTLSQFTHKNVKVAVTPTTAEHLCTSKNRTRKSNQLVPLSMIIGFSTHQVD